MDVQTHAPAGNALNEPERLDDQLAAAGRKLQSMLAQAGMPAKAMYRTGEVCALFDISRGALTRMSDGPGALLKAHRLGRNRRYAHADLVAFLAASEINRLDQPG